MERNRKIRCYINNEYCFTTTKFHSQKSTKKLLKKRKTH